MVMKNILILLFLVFYFGNLYAQNQFKPYNNKSKAITEWNGYLDQRKSEILAQYKDYKYKSELKNYITERHQDLVAKMEAGHFYFDQNIDAYFQRILNEIFFSNPTLQKEKIKFLISRYNWPNASYIGDGVIVLNIGLIDKFNYEDEFAFIICHELAHYYYEHLDLNYINRLNKLNSKETQEKIKAIKKSEYGTYTKGTSLFKGFMYDSRKHIRGHEFQADSLGFSFLQKTKYNPIAARNVLYVLDTIDKADIEKRLNIDSIFNFEEYPFKESWKSEPKQMFSNEMEDNDNWNADSLKTHPECLKRIKALNFEGFKQIGFREDPALILIKQNIKYELLLFESEFGDSGKSLVKALEILTNEPSDLVALSLISGTFQKIINARKNHNANEILMKPGETENAQLRKMLTILSNMRSIEILNVNYYFLRNALVKFSHLQKNEDFLKLVYIAAKECEKTSDLELIKNKIFK